jgi:cytoskeletal protein CcmA (bactofilin family)
MAMIKREETSMAQGDGDLLLGEGAEFDGKLTFKGTVRIDAKFKGSITTNDVLVVGAHARIDAEITCGTVIVHGEVNGNIRATSGVELHVPAKVRGDIETPSLSVERGVVVQGAVRMTGSDEGTTLKPVPSPARAALP